ncbi:MAG: hypothetical protein RLZZ175_3196 [Bacteroidota bacterium]|jgi:hypothetical protein
MWFGTATGLVKFDGTTWKKFTTTDGLPHNTIKAINEDALGNILIGSYGGFSIYNGTTFTNYNKAKNGLPDDAIIAVEVDKNGVFWLGTWFGLTKYDGKAFTTITKTSGLLDNWILTMKFDKSGNLWIGTKYGVSKFNGATFTNYTTADGLSNNNVNGITIDKFNRIWFATNGSNGCVYDNTPQLLAPTNVTATPDYGFANIAFIAPKEVVSSYTVTSLPDSIKATGTTSPITVNGLTRGKQYSFIVTANYTNGKSPASTPSTVVMIKDSVAPLAPKNVVATAGYNSATITYNAPLDNGSPVTTKYIITSNPDNHIVTTSSTSAIMSNLTAGVSYTFTVAAINSIDTSLSSIPSNSVVIKAFTEPSEPLNVTAIAPNKSMATVSFTTPLDNGGKTITNYIVTSTPGNIIASGTNSPIIVSGLTTGVSYTFTVIAKNSIGDSKPSLPSNIAIPNDSLIAHYTFDGHVNDVSGNNNNGVISGGVTFTSDADGNPNSAALFNGTDGFITVPSPNTILFKAGASFTITAKVKSFDNPGSTNGSNWTATTIFSRYGCSQISGSSENVSLDILPTNGNLRGYVRSSSVAINILQNTDNSFGQYHQFSLVKDAKAGKLLLYIDGVLVKSSSLVASFANTQALNVWIGKMEYCGGANDKKFANLFKGTMDDLKIYSRALSAAELAGTVTGIENENSSELATIASNPTDNQFEIFTPNVSSVSVYTMDGKFVESFENYQSQNFGLNYQTGIYLVKVNNSKGEKVFKVVKL